MEDLWVKLQANNPYTEILIIEYGNFHEIADNRTRNEIIKFANLVDKFSMKLDECRKKMSFEERDLKEILEKLKSREIDETLRDMTLPKVERDIEILLCK